MAVIEINENGFGELCRGSAKAVVEFYAAENAECRSLEPTLERFDKRHEHMHVCKIDIDRCPSLAAQLKVMNVPTIVFMRGGEVVSRSVGRVSVRGLEAMVNVTTPMQRRCNDFAKQTE